MTSIEQAPRRLRRDPQPLVGGVSSGVGSYLGIPPKMVRIAFIVLTILGGLGVTLYVAAWLLIPRDDPADQRPVALTSNTVALVAGFVVLTFGAFRLIDGPRGEDAAFVVPLLLIGAGFALLNRRAGEPDRGGQAIGSTRVQASWPPRSGPAAETGGQRSNQQPLPAPPVHPLAGTPMTSEHDTPDRPTWGTAHTETQQTVGPPTSPGAHGLPITSITMAAAALDLGVFLVLVNVAGLGISVTALLGSLLVVFGAGLIASAFTERAIALIPLVVLTLLLLSIAPLIDTTFSGGIGTREIRVATEDALEPTYDLGLGEMDLDLSELQPSADATVEVNAGAGTVEIDVPKDVRVEVVATSRAGYVDVFGAEDAGVRNRIFQIAESTGPDSSAGPTLRIEASVTFGYVEVARRGP